jgi:hypothetical protein
MRSISRRAVVRTLVSLPAFSMFKSIRMEASPAPWEQSGTAGPAKLNLIFHGLFAFIIWRNPKYIQAIAPIVDDHSYMAGGKALASLMQLAKGQTYELKGVNDGQMSPGFDETRNSVFQKINDIDMRQSYCQINLPFPDAVTGLRAVPKQGGCEFYKAAPKLKHKPNELPLIHAFSYTLSSAEKPSIDGLSSVYMDQTALSYNLHLRAEPKSEVFAMTGFDSLNKLFPELKAQLTDCYDNYYAHPDVAFPSGLSVEDECSLPELILNLCPPPPTSGTSAAMGKAVTRTVDGKLVNCHSVAILH